MPAVPVSLRALSERAGILSRYVDNEGTVRETTDEARIRLLACLGFAAGDEEAARRTLDGLAAEEAARVVDPVHVCHETDARRIDARGLALVPDDVRYEVVAIDEASGDQHSARGNARVRPDGAVVGLRGPKLAPGTYRLVLTLDAGGVRKTVEQWRAVAPATCTPLSEKVGRRRAFGIWTNLYAVRGPRGIGVGNLDDLAGLAELAGGAGAAFLGLNPLHALRNRGLEVSPYGPLSRLFRNSIYVAAERVPEFRAAEETRELLSNATFARDLEKARAAERVDYELVASLQGRLLETLWRTFRARATRQRKRDYERYCAAEEPLLGDFATFAAIEEEMAGTGKGRDWRAWPAELRDPCSPAVAAFRERNADRIDYHRFVQFECDRQLRGAARTAERAGMAIGLYTDLAVGSLASSFDAWEFPGLFVDDACLGAPPDPYSATGQNWGLPPVNPHRLRAGQYRYWRQMLRAAFRHCGMLRLDHAMGVLRQFWIPQGGDATGGAYVAFPAEELLALLALESRTADAVVVAEDLGTVPAGFSALLARFAVLSSRVMFFERTTNGGFVPAMSYSRRALLTANTHDQPTLAGWWQGRDLEIRRAVGMIARDDELAAAHAKRAQEKELLVRRLRTERALERPRDAEDPAELCAAVNRYLSAAPSPLLGISLDDVARETEPVNVPGIAVDRYPSWSRRMHAGLADLARDVGVAHALGGAKSRAAKRAPTRVKRVVRTTRRRKK